MDLKEAIKARHSVRQYRDLPIEEEKRVTLKELIRQCNEESGLDLQLVCDDPECFDTLLGHYGKFRNAKNYIAVIGKKDAADTEELGGYYGQWLVLEAQTMGLNTCWVAGTYGKGKCKAFIENGEKLICVIAIGYGETDGVPRKSKPAEKLCDVPENQRPDWLREGIEAAMLAPTAVNQQRFLISLKDGEPVITAKPGPMTKIDLGIVKYNFEVASGRRCR